MLRPFFLRHHSCQATGATEAKDIGQAVRGDGHRTARAAEGIHLLSLQILEVTPILGTPAEHFPPGSEKRTSQCIAGGPDYG